MSSLLSFRANLLQALRGGNRSGGGDGGGDDDERRARRHSRGDKKASAAARAHAHRSHSEGRNQATSVNAQDSPKASRRNDVTASSSQDKFDVASKTKSLDRKVKYQVQRSDSYGLNDGDGSTTTKKKSRFQLLRRTNSLQQGAKSKSGESSPQSKASGDSLHTPVSDKAGSNLTGSELTGSGSIDNELPCTDTGSGVEALVNVLHRGSLATELENSAPPTPTAVMTSSYDDGSGVENAADETSPTSPAAEDDTDEQDTSSLSVAKQKPTKKRGSIFEFLFQRHKHKQQQQQQEDDEADDKPTTESADADAEANVEAGKCRSSADDGGDDITPADDNMADNLSPFAVTSAQLDYATDDVITAPPPPSSSSVAERSMSDDVSDMCEILDIQRRLEGAAGAARRDESMLITDLDAPDSDPDVPHSDPDAAHTPGNLSGSRTSGPDAVPSCAAECNEQDPLDYQV